jgi:Protein trafficking PGA2
MVQYGPKPDRFDRMNPIQRYMQKGSLEWDDYMWLLILVLGYIAVRPYTQKVIKWILAPKDVKEGDELLKEHFEAKAKVGANTIRGSKSIQDEPTNIPSAGKSTAATGSSVATDGKVSNRKAKSTGTAKSEEEKLVDWDDEPARKPAEGDKSDVVAWLDKWAGDD